MSLNRPGTYVNEQLAAAQTSSASGGSQQAFVGALARGPVGPTLCNSWTDFNRYFGGFVGTDQKMAHAVYNYFNSGGRNAWIVRALGTGALSASRTALNSRDTATATIDFAASSAGAWGNNIYVEILAGSDPALYSTVVVRLVPTGAPAVTDAMIVEKWVDVSLDPTSPRYILTMINNSVNGSRYLTPALHTTGTAYVFAAGDVLATSVTPGGDQLTSGADGSAPTSGASGQLVTAVALLDVIADPFDLHLPGVTDSTTVNALISYCDPALGGRGDVFLIVDPQPGRSSTQLLSDIGGYTKSSYGAMYAPQQLVADPSSNVPGATRLALPGGFVAGQYAKTDASRGVFKAAAGTNNELAVLDVETRFKNSELDALNAGGVNIIKPVPGNGICIFGARTFKPSPADKYIPIRRSLIYLENQLKVVTQFAVFEPNDQLLWGHLQSVCERVLRDFWTAGGLKGSSPAQAYYAVCSDENNTDATIAAGEVHIECGVALQYPAEFVIINIGQFDGGTTITDTAA